MQVRLLGPVEVVDSGQVVELGRQQKALLALLALQPGQVVPVARLVDGLWSERLPASPENALQSTVTRMRAALGDSASPVLTRAPGYVLDVDGDAVDAVRFERLMAAAEDAGPDVVVSRLRAGLELWRGPALADVAEFPFAAPVIAHLDELRWAAYERRVEADLARGLGAELVPELEAVVADQPLREPLWADLMVALYRAGRQTDALERYQQIRRLLADEVGVEPGPRLREAEQLVLAHDPGLVGLSPGQAAVGSTALAPELKRVKVALPDLMTGAGPLFVGRAAELRRLGELWKAACSGESQLALVGGEPGIGKTRLAAELAATVHGDGAVVSAGRCDEDLGLPYQPFVEALQHYLAAVPGSLRLGRFGSELVRLVPGLADRVPGLSPPLRSDPDTERYRLFDAVASWLADLSRCAPVLLILDDLQWAARPTIALLRHLLRFGEPARLLVVGAYRNSELGGDHLLGTLLEDLRKTGGATRLGLEGLGLDDVATLISATATQTPGARPWSAEAIWADTQGNPLFVIEMLRHLRESDPGAGVPEGVREVVDRRLARLPAEARQVLELASVAGLEFEPAVIEVACGLTEDDVLDGLDEAVRARLVVELPGPVPRDRFAHALVRAAVYDGLSAARRRVLHHRLAEAIERVHAGGLDAQLPALAHHYRRAYAGGATKAVDYAARAAERAAGMLAHDEAARFYRSALDVLAVAGVPDTDPQRPELLLALGEAQNKAGDPASRQTLLDAARLARRLGNTPCLARAALANTRVYLPTQAGRVDTELVEVLTDAIAAVGESDDRMRAQLLATLGNELVYTGNWRRCLQLSDQALALARRLGDPATLARVLLSRYLPVHAPHLLDQRLATCEELLELADASGDPALRAHAHTLRAMAAMEAGQAEACDTSLAAAETLSSDLGQPALCWRVAVVRIGRDIVKGKFADAERAALRVRDGRLSGEAEAQWEFCVHQFCIARASGQFDEDLYDLVDNLKGAIKDHPFTQSMLAVTACAVGRDDVARSALHRVVDTPPPLDATWLASMTNWAVVASALADQAAAQRIRDELAPHTAYAVPFLGIPTPSVAHHSGLLATVLGDLDEAEARFRTAVTLHQQIGAPAWTAGSKVAWARMLCQRGSHGDAEHARELATDALASAKKLGAASAAAGANELLATL